MKRWLLALSLALCSLALLPSVADAKRLGGGGSSGMQRSLPARSTPDSLPAKPAQNAAAPAPATPAAPAAAAAPKRSWMGPIAGLAAGLGLAALASHFGFGGELANIMMIALLAMVAVVVVRLLMRRFASNGPARSGMQLAGAGAPLPSGGTGWNNAPAQPAASSSLASAGASSAPVSADFDAAGFERIAKMIFIRMQAANDSADLNDLRAFTTPELFASIRLDLQERGNAPQQTDVVQIDAEVLDVAQESERQIVSVRFHGLVRELRDSGATPFDEVWHLVRPRDGSREWAIAGIQQMAAA